MFSPFVVTDNWIRTAHFVLIPAIIWEISLFLQKSVTLGQETINTQVYAQLDPNQCHVMTEHMQWYTLIGEAVPGGRPVKILRLAAFATNTHPSVDFSIRVYVVEDTHDALEVDNKTDNTTDNKNRQ